MPYTAKVSSPGISVDTNNDGTPNGRIHRIRNAGNFNGFSIANGVLTIQGPTSGTSAGGSDTHVQFNDGGAIAGESTMTYNKTSNTLAVSNLTVSGELIVTTTTTLNSNTVNIGDNIIVLNSDITGTGSGTDAGIEIGRGDDANAQLLWKEATTSWDFDGYNVGAVGRVYAAGSTTPVYSFVSDTNTGIEHAAGDAMGLMVNGIRRVHIGVNGMSIVGLDGTTAAGAAGTDQALLVDNISIDDQTIATTGSNKNLILHPHGSGAVELAGVSSNATAISTLKSAHNVIGTTVIISAGSPVAGSTNNIAGGSLTLRAGAGKGTGAGGNIVFQTANQGGSGSSTNAQATALTIQDDLSAQFTGNVSIAGGLTVTGTTTSVNTTNTAVADQLLVINDGEAQNGVDNGSGLAGIEVDRGADGGTPNNHAFFVFNESDDTWNARLSTATTGLVAKSLGLGTAGELQITEASDNIIYQNTVSNKMHAFQTNFDGSAGQTFLTIGGTIKGINTGNIDIVEASGDTFITNKTANADIFILSAPFTDATCDTDHASGGGDATTFGHNVRLIQMDSTAKLRVGMAVSGTGIGSGSTITAINSATLFTVSADTTATNSNQTLTFTTAAASANFMIDGGTQRIGIGNGAPVGALHVTSSGTDDTLRLETTMGSNATSPDLVFKQTSASPASGDTIGNIIWKGVNAAGAEHEYADMYGRINATTNGSESGELYFRTFVGGTSRRRLDMSLTDTVFNEEGVDINFRVEGSGEANALFVQGSSGNVGIGTNAPIHPLDVRGGDDNDISIIGSGSIGVQNSAEVSPPSNRAWGFLSIDTGSTMVAGNIRLDDGVSGGSHDGYESGTDDRGGAGILFTNANGATGQIAFVRKDDTNDDTWAVSESMRIDEAGKVGIGLNDPKTMLSVEGTVTLKEQAAAEADTAAYGQLWVKTATPNELYFTTDAGNDIQLTSGTSAAGGGNTIGISNGNVLGANADVADDDFLRVNGTLIEGRTAAQTLSDIGAVNAGGAVTAVQAASSIQLAQDATFQATTSVISAVGAAQQTATTTYILLPALRGTVLNSGNATAIGLPNPGSNVVGDTYVIINTSGSAITIDRSGGGLFGGWGGQNLNGGTANGTLASHEAVTLIALAADSWYGIGL